MKQTAVDFLYKFLYEMESFEGFDPYNFNQEEVFAKAKAMEKKQREKDFVEGYKTRALASNLIFDEKSEYYAKTLFNRTYKTE